MQGLRKYETYTDISHILIEMSDYEYEYEDDSEYEDEYETEGSDAESCVTFTSFEGAMTAMYEQFASMDAELGEVSHHISTLEKPVATVAVSTFVQPRVLESAPFRQTKFRVQPAAQELLGIREVATFAELCQAIRVQIHERREEVERVWGTSNFLEILQQLDKFVE